MLCPTKSGLLAILIVSQSLHVLCLYMRNILQFKPYIILIVFQIICNNGVGSVARMNMASLCFACVMFFLVGGRFWRRLVFDNCTLSQEGILVFILMKGNFILLYNINMSENMCQTIWMVEQ